MNIAFITFSAKAGAGISVFQNLLPVIDKIDKKNNYFVFVGHNQEEIIHYIPETFEKIVLHHVPQNPYLRIIFEQAIMPFYLKKYKIDLLYSVGNTTILLAPCKVVLFMENPNPFSKVIKTWSFNDKLRNKLLYFLSLLSSKKATKIRFCSQRSRDIISELLKIPLSKTFVLYHGINVDNFKSNKKQNPFEFNYLLYVSVVAPHKNFEVLIDAFAIIKKKNFYEGKLVLIGDTCYSEYHEKLKKQINQLGIENEVIFTGKIPNSYLCSYYEYCDIFIYPSLEETFGIPVVEAIISGCPTMVSDGEKYKDMFIPFNEFAKDRAVYFDPYSNDDLVEKILYVLKNRDEIKSRLKKEMSKIEEDFSIKSVAKGLVEEFNKMR